MLVPLEPPLHVVLVSPQIPPNTGNVARLCAVTGCKLILVEPLGFSIADCDLKRAGLDYWDKVFVRLYPTYDSYVTDHPKARRFLFSSKVEQRCTKPRSVRGTIWCSARRRKAFPRTYLAERTECR